MNWTNKVDWIALESGYHKYSIIMDTFSKINVSEKNQEALNFQKLFNGFYRLRRNQAFRDLYYSFMEVNKNNANINFEDIVKYIYQKTNRVEASFSSKLLATVNSNMPIWDSIIIKNLNYKVPYSQDKNRIDKVVQIYDKIKSHYDKHLSSELFQNQIAEFNRRFPNNKTSDVKKIDFIIWQTR